MASKTQQTPLAPGARVEVRDEEWTVERVETDATGGEAVTVNGTSELVRDKRAVFLTNIDEVRVLAPKETQLVPDESQKYRKSRLYVESLLRRTPPTDTKIHLGHRGAIDVVDYQLQPAAKALRALRPRILLADDVGLGKTIEVGILLTELMRRGMGRRILVVAMKSILEQFQEELWARFTIPLVRLDSVGVRRVQARVPSSMNPFHFYDRVIISIDTLKNDAKYRQYLENCHWDAIVVDECQNVALRGNRSSGSQRAKLAKLLARTCDSLILTSATPHDGSAESFASLIHLLDPTAIADEKNFTAADVDHLFLRRFKKDVAHQIREEFPKRETSLERLPASPEEDAFLEEISEAQFRTIDRAKNSKGVLFRTTLLKAFLSSPVACIATIDKRLASKQLDVDTLEGAPRADAEEDRATLTHLRGLAERVTPATLTKYGRLLELLGEIGVKGKDPWGRVVVFSERVDTVQWLGEVLRKELKLKEKQVAIFHGSLDDRRQMELVKSFGSEDSPIRVLLATDVAAEGINLHYYCHHLIHFDLPWSLITMAQRNGRIDRFGQKRPPRIHYLSTVPRSEDVRGDLRILDRLVEKEKQAHQNLGDPALLMELYSEDAEVEEVSLAVQGTKSPEEVLPDEPRPRSAAEDVFLKLFGDLNPSSEPAPERAASLSLFPDDLAFAKEAFRTAVEGAENCVRWIDEAKGLELTPPADLKQRYEYLPGELRRDRDRFRLTIDRDRVQRALAEARQDESRWPEWELFWPQHPVSQWLEDRVQAAFGRHEAPILSMTSGVPAGSRAFLFQGIFSNQRNQPVLVDWFAVWFTGDRLDRVQPLEELVAATGLDREPANPNRSLGPGELESLAALRPAAVDAAREHLDELRNSRAASLGEPLREALRDLMAWADRRKAYLQQTMVTHVKDRGLVRNAAKEKRATRLQQEADRLVEERRDWIQRGLTTVPEPYIRLAAVLVPA